MPACAVCLFLSGLRMVFGWHVDEQQVFAWPCPDDIQQPYGQQYAVGTAVEERCAGRLSLGQWPEAVQVLGNFFLPSSGRKNPMVACKIKPRERQPHGSRSWTIVLNRASLLVLPR